MTILTDDELKAVRERDKFTSLMPNEVATANADRRALLHHIDALEKDAARYRWLREDQQTELGEPWCVTRYVFDGTEPVALHYEKLDAAIDAAIDAAKEAT